MSNHHSHVSDPDKMAGNFDFPEEELRAGSQSSAEAGAMIANKINGHVDNGRVSDAISKTLDNGHMSNGELVQDASWPQDGQRWKDGDFGNGKSLFANKEGRRPKGRKLQRQFSECSTQVPEQNPYLTGDSVLEENIKNLKQQVEMALRNVSSKKIDHMSVGKTKISRSKAVIFNWGQNQIIPPELVDDSEDEEGENDEGTVLFVAIKFKPHEKKVNSRQSSINTEGDENNNSDTVTSSPKLSVESISPDGLAETKKKSTEGQDDLREEGLTVPDTPVHTPASHRPRAVEGTDATPVHDASSPPQSSPTCASSKLTNMGNTFEIIDTDDKNEEELPELHSIDKEEGKTEDESGVRKSYITMRDVKEEDCENIFVRDDYRRVEVSEADLDSMVNGTYRVKTPPEPVIGDDETPSKKRVRWREEVEVRLASSDEVVDTDDGGGQRKPKRKTDSSGNRAQGGSVGIPELRGEGLMVSGSGQSEGGKRGRPRDDGSGHPDGVSRGRSRERRSRPPRNASQSSRQERVNSARSLSRSISQEDDRKGLMRGSWTKKSKDKGGPTQHKTCSAPNSPTKSPLHTSSERSISLERNTSLDLTAAQYSLEFSPPNGSHSVRYDRIRRVRCTHLPPQPNLWLVGGLHSFNSRFSSRYVSYLEEGDPNNPYYYFRSLPRSSAVS